MICPKCSQVMPEGSHFCTACGSKLDEAAGGFQAEQPAGGFQTEQPEGGFQAEQPAGGFQAEQPADGFQSEQPAGGFQTEQPAGTGYAYSAPVGETVVKKGLSKPVLFGLIGGGIFLVAAMITLLLIFTLTGRKTTFNLQDYTEMTYTGIDGNGTASAELDTGRLLEDMARARDIDVDRIKNLEADFDDLGQLLNSDDVQKILEMYSAINEGIRINLDQSEGLSNGDTIVVSYTIDEERADIAKAEFVGETMTKTVSGLNEVEEQDPFAGLTVSFEGVSPNAFVSIQNNNTSDAARGIWFEPDRAAGLKIGEKIKISVQGYDAEEFESTYGVRFTQTEKEYTVGGVEAFITENEELDKAALDILQPSTEDYVLGYFADKNRAEYIKAEDIRYEGYFLLTNKNSEVWYGFNKVYVIFSATVSSKEKKKQFKPTKVYLPVEYDDIKTNANGGYDIATDYKNILGSTDLKFGFWEVVSGYRSVEDMEEELIEADNANYDGKVYGDLAQK